MLLGYIRDTKAHDVLASLGIYDSSDSSRDATRTVVWQPGAERAELVEYDGESCYECIRV
jgi:protein disulfide-isomerase A6